MSDRALSDALWLTTHPGWSWRALQETPADVVELMNIADTIRADVAERRAKG